MILLKVYYNLQDRETNNPEYVLTFPDTVDVDTVTMQLVEREYARQRSTGRLEPEQLASWYRDGLRTALSSKGDVAVDLRLTPPVLIVAAVEA